MKKYRIDVFVNDDLGEEVLTSKDFEDFLKAKNFREQIRIITIHSQKNQQNFEKRSKIMEENKNFEAEENADKIKKTDDAEIVKEQFSEFLHTKGLKAKFKLAFKDMAENAKEQKKRDAENFEEVKAKSREENKDFYDFLHTKGLKAKFHLVIENIKRSAKENSERMKEERKANEARQKELIESAKNPVANKEISATQLSKEFNDFLKAKGLDKYSITITEEE